MSIQTKRVSLVVAIQLIIAAILVFGMDWAGKPMKILFHGYFADIFLPFGFYFLLFLRAGESQFLNTWWKKVLAVFTLCSISETLQYFGVYALATIFDPLDFVMYGVGVLLAVLFDRQVFARALPFWKHSCQ
jgi:hypothetical protein